MLFEPRACVVYSQFCLDLGMAPTKLSPRKIGTVAPNYSRFRSQVKLHDVQRQQQHQRGGLDLSMDLSNVIGMDEFEERCRTEVAEYEASD